MAAFWYIGSILVGFSFGVGIAATYRALLPRGSTAAYFSEITGAVQGLLFGKQSEFWKHYREAITLTFRFVGRQIVTLVAAFLPLFVAMILLAPLIWPYWNKGGVLVVEPPSAGAITALDHEGKISGEQPQLRLENGENIHIPITPLSVALCAPEKTFCHLLGGLGFRTTTANELKGSENQVVIVRVHRGDWNPVWPYLNDPEFLFFIALMAASMGLMLRGSGGDIAENSQFGIGPIDSLLTQIAANSSATMVRLGNTETRWKRDSLNNVPIQAPVFIAGLARSGTTILLEKLSSIDGVATHQYRDFPFIMTPIVWNKVISILGRRQQPVERPHGDSIEITRDSPEAFEEPIWQHFFPGIHDPERCQVLDSDTHNELFETFYCEHIRKILFLRGGSRYVSKGNYNLPRIKYLARLFPDAIFLVPVRHPGYHIESLVKQHHRFLEYAASDAKIAPYLRAVGHYEFGPQRLPINIDKEGTIEALRLWKMSDDAAGYARQWADLYSFVLQSLSDDSQLARRTKLVRFEDLGRNPRSEIEQILSLTGLDSTACIDDLVAGIDNPDSTRRTYQHFTHDCWGIVENVARQLGYVETTGAHYEELERSSRKAAP